MKSLLSVLVVGAAMYATNNPSTLFSTNTCKVVDKYVTADNNDSSFVNSNYDGDYIWKINNDNNVTNNYDTIYQKLFNRLMDYLDDYDDNEDNINVFFENLISKVYFEDFYFWLFSKASNAQKELIISSILSSDVDIFTSWYKKSLLLCAKSNSTILSSKSLNILNLYKKQFEAIVCM